MIRAERDLGKKRSGRNYVSSNQLSQSGINQMQLRQDEYDIQQLML